MRVLHFLQFPILGEYQKDNEIFNIVSISFWYPNMFYINQVLEVVKMAYFTQFIKIQAELMTI